MKWTLTFLAIGGCFFIVGTTFSAEDLFELTVQNAEICEFYKRPGNLVAHLVCDRSDKSYIVGTKGVSVLDILGDLKRRLSAKGFELTSCGSSLIDPELRGCTFIKN